MCALAVDRLVTHLPGLSPTFIALLAEQIQFHRQRMRCSLNGKDAWMLNVDGWGWWGDDLMGCKGAVHLNLTFPIAIFICQPCSFQFCEAVSHWLPSISLLLSLYLWYSIGLKVKRHRNGKRQAKSGVHADFHGKPQSNSVGEAARMRNVFNFSLQLFVFVYALCSLTSFRLCCLFFFLVVCHLFLSVSFGLFLVWFDFLWSRKNAQIEKKRKPVFHMIK